MKVFPSFKIPMYNIEKWENHDKYQPELIDLCYRLQHQKQTSGVAPRAKHGLYESDFDLLARSEECIVELREHIRSSIFQAANDANREYWAPGSRIGIDIHESWCHISPGTGSWHDMHNHPNSSWSAIYYLRCTEVNVDTLNGCSRFYSPWQPAYSDVGMRWASNVGTIDVPARDGEMVVFPSFLMHSGLPYFGKEDRLLIAVNCKFIDGTDK